MTIELAKEDASHLPLCKCADTSATCLGRQPGVACMAHDDWYSKPALIRRYEPPDEEEPWWPLFGPHS